jgi:hypothetical protein
MQSFSFSLDIFFQLIAKLSIASLRLLTLKAIGNLLDLGVKR